MDDTVRHNQWVHRGTRATVEKTLEVLFRWRWISIGIFLTILSSAFFYGYATEPEFESQTFVKVDIVGDASPLTEMLSPGLMGGFGVSDRSLESEIFILRSSKVLVERVANRIIEQKDSLVIAPGQGVLSHIDEGFWGVELIADALFESVSFSPASSGISAIVITAKAPLPLEAAQLANLYAEEYIKHAEESDRVNMTVMHDFLAEQEYDRRQELRRIEDQIELLLQERGALGADEESKFLVQQVLALEADLNKTQTELMAQRSVLSSIEEELKEVHPLLVRWVASSKDKQIEAIQQQIAELDFSREQISMRHNDSTSPVIREDGMQEIGEKLDQLHARVDELSQEYVEEVMAAGGWDASLGRGRSSGDLTTLRSQAVQTKIRISGLAARYDLAKEQLREKRAALVTLPSTDLELARLQRQYKYAEEMYRYVMEQLLQVRFTAAAETGYASMIRAADVPEVPARPRPVRNLVVGFLLALFVSLNTAFVIDSLGGVISQPEHLDHAGCVILGVIPDMQPFIAKHHGKKKFKSIDGKKLSTSLIPALNPRSSLIESYQSLRANVEYNLLKRSCQSLLVTSAGPVEGKSVTASNLALVMAQAGVRTALIDLDFRRPSIHKMFGLSQKEGFIDLYLGQKKIDDLIIDPFLENLHVLPAGSSSKGQVEIINTMLFKIAVRMLSEKFDVIIFDAPPVLAAAEVKTFAATCDATLLVAEAGSTKESYFSHAKGELLSVDANILGGVLNKFDVKTSIRHRNRYKYYQQYEKVHTT